MMRETVLMCVLRFECQFDQLFFLSLLPTSVPSVHLFSSIAFPRSPIALNLTPMHFWLSNPQSKISTPIAVHGNCCSSRQTGTYVNVSFSSPLLPDWKVLWCASLSHHLVQWPNWMPTTGCTTSAPSWVRA